MTTATEGSLAAAYAGLVCDLDGVVYRGPAAVDHAVETLQELDVPVQYATNNASREPGEVAAQLTRLGLRVRPVEVATSAQAAAAAVLEQCGAGALTLAVGGPGVADALVGEGLVPVRSPEGREVVAVVQGYGTAVSATDLAEAAYAVEAGAYWVATNVDLTLPTDRGVAPGNGTLVRAVSAAVGHEPDEIVGKPYPALYVLCAQRLESTPERLLAVGDRLDTDIEGAVRAGLDSLMVLSGVDDIAAVARASATMRPTYLARDLRALRQVLPVPVFANGAWSCGEDVGRVVGTRWATTSQGTADQGLTNRLHAAYAAQDAGALSPQAAAALVAEGDG